MNNYSIGFDAPNAASLPYGDPVTTHNPMYVPGTQMPSPPDIGFKPTETESIKKPSFSSRNKIDDDHKTQEKGRPTDNREKVYIFFCTVSKKRLFHNLFENFELTFIKHI